MKRFTMALAISLSVLFSLQVISCKKEVAPNQQFVGLWTGTTNCGGTPYAEQWNITAQTGSTTGINLVSIGGNTLSTSLKGTVSGNSLTIASQYDAVDSVTVSGSGSISSNQLSLTIADNAGDNCLFTGSK